MAYATPDELARRYDAREISQLASDSGVPATSISTNPQVLLALEDASADIDAALTTGGRYSLDGLAALTGSPLSLLKRITCELAMTYLMERRPNLDADQLQRFREIRDRHLERLRKGENIFALPGPIEAGKPNVSVMSSIHRNVENTIRFQAEGHYYPRRRDPWR